MRAIAQPTDRGLNRRAFLRCGLALGTMLPAWRVVGERVTSSAPGVVSGRRSIVAIVTCPNYGPGVRASLEQAFDLLGGIGSLVRGKTVTVKINLTGTSFGEFLGRPMERRL
jgi:hypothetical protein